jgi:hypothetical protein
MPMPIVSIIVGLLLVAQGFIGYFASGQVSKTPFIASGFGVPFILFGIGSLANPGLRKHLMHGAAGWGLLGALMGLGMSLPKIFALIFSGTQPPRPMATWHTFIMGTLCVLFVSLAVRSFIAARKARQQGFPIA